jgi:hypothetical protein
MARRRPPLAYAALVAVAVGSTALVALPGGPFLAEDWAGHAVLIGFVLAAIGLGSRAAWWLAVVVSVFGTLSALAFVLGFGGVVRVDEYLWLLTPAAILGLLLSTPMRTHVRPRA